MTRDDRPEALRPLLAGSAPQVARRLLGATLRSVVGGETVEVRLSEVEAYQGEDDPGSHAHRGRTARTEVMFGEPGHLYVYFTYGMHWCANVVTGEVGRAAAVLLRAGEVVRGHEVARARRPACRRDVDLARGPARLASALGIDGAFNGHDLGVAPLVLLPPGAPVRDDLVSHGPRVGVSGPGGDGDRFPWRFWITGDPTVSTYRPGRPRRSSGAASTTT